MRYSWVPMARGASKSLELTLSGDDDSRLVELCDGSYEGVGKAWLARAFFRYGMMFHAEAWAMAGKRAAERDNKRKSPDSEQ